MHDAPTFIAYGTGTKLIVPVAILQNRDDVTFPTRK